VVEQAQSPTAVLFAETIDDDAGHAVHASSPLKSLYVSPTHASHRGPVNPAKHPQRVAPMPTLPVSGGQSTQDTAFTVVPYLPGSQLTQDRRSGVYFPGTHVSQTPPCAPFHPALHSHAVLVVLMAGESE